MHECNTDYSSDWEAIPLRTCSPTNTCTAYCLQSLISPVLHSSIFFCQYRIAIRQVQYKLYHWIELQEATVTDLQSHKDLHCFFVLHVKGQISPILHWLQWLAFCMTSCMIPPASSEVAWYNSYIPQRYHVLAIFKAKHITQIRSKGILHSVWALMVDHVSYEFPIYILLLYSLWLAQAGLIEYDHVWSWHI